MAKFYGNPETLRGLNKNLKTLDDQDFLEQVTTADNLLRPQLEGDLRSIFSSWPAATSLDQNAISTLWHYLLTQHFQATKLSSNTMGQMSGFGKDVKDEYALLLQSMKAGNTIVPGAVRASRPKISNMAKQRWVVSEGNQPDEPQGVADNFPKGLRN